MKQERTMNKRLIQCSAILILVAMLPGASVTQVDDSDAYRQLELFGEVFEQIRERYVEQVSDAELIQGAIRGMTRQLDPHSSYLAPAAFESMRVRTSGRFGGVGIEITMENGQVKVIAPIEGGPASEIGIQSGDVITHADSLPLSGLSLQEVVGKIRGQVDTTVHLTIQRGQDEILEFTITRAIVRVRSVRHRVERDGIGYVRISHFNGNASQGLRESIQELETMVDEPGKGLILDLRDNPGGLLSQAVGVTDLFLEQGEIVSVRGRESDGERYNATPGDILNGRPLVILINGGAASASEVVSGALQDHQRAIILGTRSFGKGSVQRIIDLPRQQGALRLTTSRYYTPSGRSIQRVGVTPDFVVPAVALEISSPQRVREADLPGAIDDDNQPDGTDQDQAIVRRDDYQLERAIDLLQGIWLYSSQR